MEEDLFEYHPMQWIECLGGPVIYVICRDKIQQFAEKRLNRQLTNLELAHLPMGFDHANEDDYLLDGIQRGIAYARKSELT